MRIPTDPPGGKIPSASTQNSAKADAPRFQEAEPASVKPGAAGPARPDWKRTDLADPAKANELIRESASWLVSQDRVAGRLSDQQRAEMAGFLANDPAMRQLLTRYLEGVLA
ncbi:MAG: hypothetical protein SFV54_22070 [Bryobacteraceae bacterium]|nr:hypothetical protein [Bryobacteraceae bacterium]